MVVYYTLWYNFYLLSILKSIQIFKNKDKPYKIKRIKICIPLESLFSNF